MVGPVLDTAHIISNCHTQQAMCIVSALQSRKPRFKDTKRLDGGRMVTMQMQVWGSRVLSFQSTLLPWALASRGQWRGREGSKSAQWRHLGRDTAALEELCQLTRPGNEEWMEGKSQGTEML